MQKAVETKVGKIGVAKIKRGRGKRRGRKKVRRKGKEEEEKTKERKDDRSKESSGRVGDLE